MPESFLFEKNIFQVITGEIEWDIINIDVDSLKCIINCPQSYINIIHTDDIIKIINTQNFKVYEYNLENQIIKEYKIDTNVDLITDYTLITYNNDKYMLDFQLTSQLFSPIGGHTIGISDDGYINLHFLLMKNHEDTLITAFSEEWIDDNMLDYNYKKEEKLFTNYENINYYQYKNSSSIYYRIILETDDETISLKGKLKNIKNLFIMYQIADIVLVNSLSFDVPLYFSKKKFLDLIKKYIDFEIDTDKRPEKYTLKIYPEGNYWEKINFTKEKWFKLKHSQLNLPILEKIYDTKFIKTQITENIFCAEWCNYKYYDKCIKKLGDCYYLDEGPLSLYKINFDKDKEDNYKLKILDTIFLDSWISDPKKAHDVFTPHPYFDTSSSLFYHPIHKLFYLFTRCNVKSSVRTIVVSTSKDLKEWSEFEVINIKNFNFICGNYYVPGLQYYPKTNLMASVNYYIEENGNSYLQFMYTKNGVNCEYFNMSNIRKHNDVHDNLITPIFNSIFNYKNKSYFLLSKTINTDNQNIHIGFLPKNRWNGLLIHNQTEILTGNILESVNELKLNYKVNPNGFIKICILDQNNKIISDYDNMIALTDDNFNEKVIFKKICKIKKGYKLKLLLKNCLLYTINLMFQPIESKTLFNTIEFWYHEYYPHTYNDMKTIQLKIEKNGIRAKKIVGKVIYNDNLSKATINVLFENNKIEEIILYDTTKLKKSNLLMCLDNKTSHYYKIGKIKPIKKYIKVRETIYNLIKTNKLKCLNKKIVEEYKEILDFCKDTKNIKEIENDIKGIPARVFNCQLKNL